MPDMAASLSPLLHFLRFRSISAHADSATESAHCAHWLATHLREIGMRDVRVVTTRGNPVVVAEWLDQPAQPTVLIYGHYDVQPADPLTEWVSPPFEPTIRGDHVYARGASDDKGQLFTHVCAIEQLLRATRRLPANVKFLIEGEEEIGSPNLNDFLREYRERLTAACAVVSDTLMVGPDQPAITYALRGSLDVELEVTGQRSDLHSGNFGGALYNPLQGLCEIVAKLHDGSGRILIPSFYDRAREVSAAERNYMRRYGPSDHKILSESRAVLGQGEFGFTLYESTTIRPSISITGITGGYQGPGPKGVIPARASAKLNLRLVPDQEPAAIDKLLREYLASVAPAALQVRITTQKQTRPTIVKLRHPAIRAAFSAYQHAFGRPPIFVRSGGTIPVVDLLQRILGIPTVLMGFALPDDALHGPNERMHLPTFVKGIAASTHFLNELGRATAAAFHNRTVDHSRATNTSAVFTGAHV
jgi:acetylornithine deacetylase/succinyl-diaminopimelate desuccinylase-like protein